MKKYEFTGETIDIQNGITLHRIRAIRDTGRMLFSGKAVKAGTLGGFIQSEDNLSHEGDCWVGDSARVFENAKIIDDALVCGEAVVRCNATVSGHARIHACATIGGHANVKDFAAVGGRAYITDLACVDQDVWLGGEAYICGTAHITGQTAIKGLVDIWRGEIRNNTQILSIGPIGRRIDTTTFIYDDGDIYVKCGCFMGDIKEFEDAVNATHAYSPIYQTQYLNAIEFVKKTFHDLHSS